MDGDRSFRGYRIERITHRESGARWVYDATVAASGERVRVIAFPLPEEPRLRRRVRRSVKKRAGVRHPNVLPVREVFEDDGHLYAVAEAADAVPLARTLEGGPLVPQAAARVL